MYDTVKGAAVGSLTLVAEVKGEITIEGKQVFENHFDLPIIAFDDLDEAPGADHSFWFSRDPSFVSAMSTQDSSILGSLTPSESFADDGTLLDLPDELMDRTLNTVSMIGFQENTSLWSNFSPALVNRFLSDRLYIRFDMGQAYDVEGGLFYLQRPNELDDAANSKTGFLAYLEGAGEFLSGIVDFGYDVPRNECGKPTYIYVFGEKGSPAPASLSHPICVMIDDYAAVWEGMGLETDEEIKAYLDSLPYESFVPAEEDAGTAQQKTITVDFYMGGGGMSSGGTIDLAGVETAYVQINFDPSNPAPKAPDLGMHRYCIDWIADDYYRISDVVYDFEDVDFESDIGFVRFLKEGNIISPDGSVVNASGLTGSEGRVILVDCLANSIGTISFTVQKVDAPV